MAVKKDGRYGDLGPLYDLLINVCPPSKKGRRSIIILSEKLGVSYQYIYKWIETGRVPAKYVKPILELSDGKIKQQDILPFVI